MADTAALEEVLLDGLRSAAFPAHAQALVHVPSGFSAAAPAALLYLHGFENCIFNALRARETPCPHGYPPQASAELVAGLVRAGRGAALIVPEVLPHAARADPGALAEPGALRALLNEVCARSGGPLGALRAADFRRVIVVSHSGAYRVAAALVSSGGGVPVQELYLLDSLYGEEARFEAYVTQLPAAYGPGGDRRLVLLYGESTAERCRALWLRLRGRLLAAGVPAGRLRYQDQAGDLDAADLEAAVLCRRVAAEHSDMPRAYLADLLRGSGLPAV